MAIKSYICDECLKEVGKEEIKRYCSFDLCNECDNKYLLVYLGQEEKIQKEIQKLYRDMRKNFPNIYSNWELVNGRKRIFKLEEEI